MKNMTVVSLGFIAIIIVLYTSLPLFSGSILRSNLPEPIKFFVQSFFPPKDLYRLLVKEEIDLSQGEIDLIKNFSHKYPGRYEFGIILQDAPSDFYFNKASHILYSIMEVVFLVDGKKVKHYSLSGEFSPFTGKDGKGLILGVYTCPADLPIDKSVTVEIATVGPSSPGSNKRPASFYIKKFSDK
jgi:hypothetical protein